MRQAVWERVEVVLARSTFHGVDIVMEAPSGYRRRAAALFLAAMTLCAVAGTIYSLLGFLHFPYKTLVNYEQRPCSSTQVTLCPFSPFSAEALSHAPEEAREKFNKLLHFWNNYPEYESLITKYLKRSFTPSYYRYSKYLKREWNSLLLSCHYNGESCLKDIIDIEHPMAYQCFQISLNLSFSKGARSGYARGLQLILFRNYSSIPILMLNEFYNQIYTGFINGNEVKFDGILIIVHNKDELPSYKLTSSPNNYPILFGNRISMTFKEKYYKQTKTIKRQCSNSPVYYKLLKLTDYFKSRIIENQKNILSLNLGNCASKYRQQLLSLSCNCFTENEMVPSELSQDFKSKGFCHDVLRFENKSKESIKENIYCSKKIELMPDKEILKNFKRQKVSIINRAKSICAVPCDRTILRLKRIQKNKILYPMNLSLFSDYFKTMDEQNLISPFDLKKINELSLLPKNLIIIDIHAEEERIPILDEDLDKNLSNFIAEVGGVFGLFLGFSGVTAFEILECFILLLSIILIAYRKKSFKIQKQRK